MAPVKTALCLLFLTFHPSSSIINSDCTHEFYSQTFQQFLEKENNEKEIENQIEQTRSAMFKSLKKKATKKCQYLTKLNQN